MTTKTSTKAFDCVEMMHQGVALVRRELEGKSLEEQPAYWREGTDALLKRQAQLRKTRFQTQGAPRVF